METLIISLNQDLSIYTFNSDNNYNLVLKQEKVDRSLNLSESFAKVFVDLPECLEYYLFIGDQAGFMDSRIVYIWLSNKAYFDNIDYYVNRSNFDHNQIINQLTKAKLDNFQDLAYSREPNIGSR